MALEDNYIRSHTANTLHFAVLLFGLLAAEASSFSFSFKAVALGLDAGFLCFFNDGRLDARFVS